MNVGFYYGLAILVGSPILTKHIPLARNCEEYRGSSLKGKKNGCVNWTMVWSVKKPFTALLLDPPLMCIYLFSGLGIALGATSLVAVIMTGVIAVLCCKLRSQGSTGARKLVRTQPVASLFNEGPKSVTCRSTSIIM